MSKDKPAKNTKKGVVAKIVDVEHDVEDVMSDTFHSTSLNFKPKTTAGRKFRIFIKRKLPNYIGRNYKTIFLLCVIIFMSGYSYVTINGLQTTIQADKSEISRLVKSNSELLDNKIKNTTEIKSIKDRLAGSSFVIVNKTTLINDMAKRFPAISVPIADDIVTTVMEEAKKYNINPIILYSLGVVESSHRYWIEHVTATISVPRKDGKGNKKIKAKAVGWGGVMWEHHYKMLQNKGIANTRADLFFPQVNIRAAASIYNLYFNMKKKKGAKNQDVSAQRRYFGGNYKSYSDRINKQVVELVNAEIYRLTIEETEEGNVK